MKANFFKDFDSGVNKVQSVVDTEVKKLKGSFEPPDSDLKLKHRRTYYLDTFDSILRSKNFFLRIREDMKSTKYDVTLKCRHPDRYISSTYNLSNPKIHDVKFEEDIIAPHVSKFSVSVNFEQDQEPNINNIKELKSNFPGLSHYDLGDGKLLKVNDFEAKEISVKLGEVRYDGRKGKKKDDDKINVFLNLWYTPKDEKMPVIVEFTYSYLAIKPDQSIPNKGNSAKIIIEEFPLSLVKNTYEFYNSLQKTEIMDPDPDASKTKTEFVYDYKP